MDSQVTSDTFWESGVARLFQGIRAKYVTVITREAEVERIPADFVLAMTGYEPDTSLLKAAGAHVDDAPPQRPPAVA